MDNSNQDPNANNQATPTPTWPPQQPVSNGTPIPAVQTQPVAAPMPSAPSYPNTSLTDYSTNPTGATPTWPATQPAPVATPSPSPTPPAPTMAPVPAPSPFPAPAAAPAAPSVMAPTVPDFLPSWGNQNAAVVSLTPPAPVAPAAPQQPSPVPETPAPLPASAPIPSVPTGPSPADQLSPFFSQTAPTTFTNQVPSPSNINPGQNPTNLSQLTETPAAAAAPETTPVQPAPSQSTPNPLLPPAPTASPVLNRQSSNNMNKFLIAVGGVLVIILFSSIGYFIWLSNKAPIADSTSIPAVQAPLTNPPKPIVQEPAPAQAATSDTLSPNPTASASGQSAFDILKSRAATASASQ